MTLIQNDNAGDWQSQQSAVWTPAPAAELEVWTGFAPESDLFAEAQDSTPGVWKVLVKRRLNQFLHRRLLWQLLFIVLCTFDEK